MRMRRRLDRLSASRFRGWFSPGNMSSTWPAVAFAEAGDGFVQSGWTSSHDQCGGEADLLLVGLLFADLGVLALVTPKR